MGKFPPGFDKDNAISGLTFPNHHDTARGKGKGPRRAIAFKDATICP